MTIERLHAATRLRLSNRRRALTETLEHDGQKLIATVGIDPEIGLAEIFISGAKDGSHLNALLADISIAISLMRQYGIPIAAFAKSISRVPIEIDGPAVKPASIFGAAVDLLMRLEAELSSA